MIQHLTEIVEEARKRGKKRLAVAYGQDSHTLEAVYEAYKEGLVEPTLFGDKEVIKQVCQENGIDINAFNIVNEPNDVKCVQQAVASVVSGNADVLMKGLVSTDKYMRGILNKEAGLFPPKGVLSHVSIVEMPCYHKLLIISDVAVIPLPDFKQKMVQIGYLARTANLLGIATPKIACIAPSEQLLPNVISSTEGALLAKMADRGQLGNVVVEDDVEIGANTCIDRAKTDSTIIRRGVKLDNLIQIGHNVQIGENTVSSAQTGIAGTSKVGHNCFLAGQVGIADHVTIGDRVCIGSKSGLDKDVPDGEVRFGYPALPGMQYHRSATVFKRLPELEKRVNELEKQLAASKK